MASEAVRLLLVEDNLNDVELTLRALKKHKLANSVYVVRDGEEALEFLFGTGRHAGRSIQQSPNLVLLDLNMPGMDGLEVLRRIRADERTKTLPTVVLTSSGQHPDITAAYELGANGFVTKPVEFDAFMKAVSELGLYWLLVNEPPQ